MKKVAIAIDFDECLIQGNASTLVATMLGFEGDFKRLWKGIADREFCSSLAGKHVDFRVDKREYDTYCAFGATLFPFAPGAVQFFKAAKNYAKLYVISTGYYDLIKNKLEEEKLEAEVLATKFIFSNGYCSSIEHLVSSEEKEAYVWELRSQGSYALAIGHDRGDEGMLAAANFSIGLNPAPDVKCDFKASSFNEIQAKVEEIIQAL